MKIKLLFLALILSGTFLNAQNEDTSSGWEEGVIAIIDMTPFDLDKIESIYVGNLPVVWRGEGAENIKVYTNDKKNIYILVEEGNDGFLKYELTKKMKKMLRNKNLKAFTYKGVTSVVNKKGKVVKTIKT